MKLTETTTINPLDALLASDLKTEKQVYIKRLDTYFTIRGIGDEEFSECTDEATFYSGQGKNRKKEVNEQKLSKALVAVGCTAPDFKDKQVLEKFSAKTAVDAIGKSLLAGEVVTLMQEIMQISGFDNDIEEIKN